MKKIILIILTLIITISCTEPYKLETETFEDALVIEASITNELKHHEITLSRTFRFEENGPTYEQGAIVTIKGTDGSTYSFEEVNQKYISIDEFQPTAGILYTLEIKTSNGKNYKSTAESLTTVNLLNEINANVKIISGKRGVEISANSFDPNNNSKYYRFTYEETYKVIVPKWSPNKAVVSPNGQQILIQLRDNPETRVCYKTSSSNEIITTSTTNLVEDRILNFPIRFIPQHDYSIANRYSILVNQYIQNRAAYNYYTILNKISGSGSILTQNQPGFFDGNIKNIDNEKEKIIGFFDVSTVSSKRLFFNYEDMFPGELFPEYFETCDEKEFDSSVDGPGHANDGFTALKSAITANRLILYQKNGTIYKMVKPVCGDCTTYASNIIPDFWEWKKQFYFSRYL